MPKQGRFHGVTSSAAVTSRTGGSWYHSAGDRPQEASKFLSPKWPQHLGGRGVNAGADTC